MKTFLTLAGAVVIALSLAACSPGIHGKFGHNISFQNGELVSHAVGQPNAYVDADGNLRIGKRKLAVTPSQRALLKEYYGESKAVMAQGEVVGKQGAKLGLHAIGHAVKSIFTSDSKQADQALDAQANTISAVAQKLCTSIQHLHATQQSIAAQLLAFKPYDAIGEAHCSVTTTSNSTSFTASNDSTTLSASRTPGVSGAVAGKDTAKQVTTH